MEKLTSVVLTLILCACATPDTERSAAGQKCQAQDYKVRYPSSATLKIQMCVKQGTLEHDVYTLNINGSEVLQVVDDQSERLEGKHLDYKVTGGCVPKVGDKEKPVKEARTCTINIDGQQAASFFFKFD